MISARVSFLLEILLFGPLRRRRRQKKSLACGLFDPTPNFRAPIFFSLCTYLKKCRHLPNFLPKNPAFHGEDKFIHHVHAKVHLNCWRGENKCFSSRAKYATQIWPSRGLQKSSNYSTSNIEEGCNILLSWLMVIDMALRSKSERESSGINLFPRSLHFWH